MEFIPLEDDLLSMELDDVARDIYLVRLFLQGASTFQLTERVEWG